LQVAHLHMTEAADLFGDYSKADRHRVIVRRQIGEDLLEHGLVVPHELALGLAFGGVAEQVERRAAQELEPRQYSKHAENPGTEGDLARLAGALVATRQQRRGEMHVEPQLVAADLVGDLRAERITRIEPRDL